MTTSGGAAVKAAPWKDPTARPYVQVDRITKSFGDFKAVNDVSLKIYQGEIFCLLGASGWIRAVKRRRKWATKSSCCWTRSRRLWSRRG